MTKEQTAAYIKQHANKCKDCKALPVIYEIPDYGSSPGCTYTIGCDCTTMSTRYHSTVPELVGKWNRYQS